MVLPKKWNSRFASAIILATGGASLIAADNGPGYLNSIVDISIVVPPPPQKGDPRYEADRRVFRATRAMLNTPRGHLALSDVPYAVPDLMGDFSCAAGISLSSQTTPAIYRLLVNSDADTQRANDAAKLHWKRRRPFLIDRGPICQNKAELANSYDYPSGHATHGWTIGLVLAELLPARANQILVRARAYGESRIVCGAHNMSAVEAARLGATVSFQHVRNSEGYRSDFIAAEDEMKKLKAADRLTSDTPSCSAEAILTARSVLVPFDKSVRVSPAIGMTR